MKLIAFLIIIHRKFRYGVNLLTVGEKLLNFRLPFMFLVHGWLDGGNKIWVKRTINGTLSMNS